MQTTGESQNAESNTTVAEPSTDDKELFLKVLENLKNYVSKTENDESQQTTVGTKPDVEERGTTTVTVSDKTKSLILQKLAIERSANNPQTSSSSVISKKEDEMSSDLTAVSKQNVLNVTLSSSPIKPGGRVIAVPVSTNSVVVSYRGLDNVSSDAGQNSGNVKTTSKGNTYVAKPVDKFQTVRSTSTSTPQKTPSVQLFPCNFCDYYSDNKNYLKQHVDLVHTSERPYKCPYCDYAGKRSHALREHLIVHTDERPFQCKVCNATFRKKGHLTNHIKLHNSKRLVKCPLCKALVYDVGENGLDAHLKNDHDTERLFGCDLCDHVAATEPDILKHLSQKHKFRLFTHTCDKCPFETADALDFKAHINAHEMTEVKVEIGTEDPTKVIGVATIPTGKFPPGIPNTTVKFTGSFKNTADRGTATADMAVPQSAMIKPVWIKCSVCGFVEHDSEAIKVHMLEHLKDQYGDSYIHQLKSDPGTKPETTEPVPENIVSQPVRQEKVTLQAPKTPILIPVTNVEKLLPQHAGKIDMNSPILVPVTDPSVIKSLQNQAGIMTSALSPSSLHMKTSSVVKGKPLDDVQSKTESQTMSTQPNQVPVADKLTVSFGAQAPVTDQSLPKSSSVTVLTLANRQLTMSSGSTNSNQNSHSVASAGQPVVAVKNSVNTVPLVTEIPVPRSVSLEDVPKLPPELCVPSSADNQSNNATKKSASAVETEPSEEQKLALLKENLANVQKLIREQEKISKQAGNSSVVKLDSQGIPEKLNINGVVYYMEPSEKKNTLVVPNESFTHDSVAGRFKCTLCGYTCEYQRTIKAHIWKHSGNKNVDYPMFQNGPLSVYEDEGLPGQLIKIEHNSVSSAKTIQMIQNLPGAESSSASKLPPFIVYEKSKISDMAPALANFITAKKVVRSTVPKKEGKISNVAPALANLIVARTMVEMTDEKTDDKHEMEAETDEQVEGKEADDPSADECKLTIDETEGGSDTSVPADQSVVVEVVNSVANGEGFTAIQSQQNSPRVSARSPDSGVAEMYPVKPKDDKSRNVNFLAGNSHALDDSVLAQNSSKKRTLRSSSAKEMNKAEGSATKKAKFEEAHEDSAVTLLSLLKKGPNFNPACPTSNAPVLQYSSNSSPGQEDSNSIGDSDAGSGKPKSGISTSLLAVIEQLRERSKSDVDDDKPQAPPLKKQYKRRSRKSSIEDNTPASGIENVEEFVKAGEVKYRCKLCHYTNDSTLLLRQHMKLHKPKKEFECSLCDLIAESSEALQDHMIQHCKVRTYQCKLCSSAFSYKSQLRAHLRMHNDQDILMCDFCDFETRNAADFRLHLKSHATKMPYKCATCNGEFETSLSLRQHKRDRCQQPADKVDKVSNSGYACDECDFVSVGRRELKNHQKMHMGKAVMNLPKKCPYCEYSDVTIEMIRKHISEVHGESKPLKCEMCGFFAVSIRSLKSHMKRHVNDQRFVAQPLEQYKCNLCGYVCHHLPSLKSHMWRHAPDQHYSYEFTNDVINGAIDFDSMTDVTETEVGHVEFFRQLILEKMKVKGLEHTKDTFDESAKACCWVTFRCCQCGFETINKAELNMHMTAHTDVIKKTLEVADGADSGPQSQDESES